MEYRTILSSSSKLKKNSLYKVTITEQTKELLYQINTSILNAHEAGLSTVDVRLPINFPQIDNNVSNRELQITIYYNIITELERLGYKARLTFMKKFTLLCVDWVVKAPDDQLDEMQAKLMSISMNGD